MKLCLLTLGCKINQYESGQIARHYADLGYEIVHRFVPDADIYVVNTCSVTAAAEKKSRNTVSRVRRAVDGFPDRSVIVCGCAGDRGFNDGFKCDALHTKKRAFIKVQDGCNNFCSYCIVPYLRGRSRSRPMAPVIAEIKSAGKPVVVTGIDLSSYGLDIGTNLGALCTEIDKCGLPFELSSMEIGILDTAFLQTLLDCKNFIPKFHVPLQSGSTKVLRDMNRKYTKEKYLETIERVRAAFPNAQISTDVIIGFPTETPADLAETYDVIDKAKFFHVHTFPYSDRDLKRFRGKKDT